MRRARHEGGQALIEAALTIPIVLLIAVGIFEFGRAYQTWEILTNAAREGARVSILPGADPDAVTGVVRAYMQGGRLGKYATAEVVVNRAASITVNGNPVSASQVTINYPFEFMVLKPVASLIRGGTAPGDPITMQASALMRNE
jgi:Flp pilus assembly protein TadG